MNTAAIVPREERRVCKCHGSECVSHLHVYLTKLSVALKIVHRTNDDFVFYSFFYFGSYRFV